MESCDLSAKKLRIIAQLIKKAKDERVLFSLTTPSPFPDPIYHQSGPSDTLNLKELQEKLLLQTTLIDKLSRALNYCRKRLKNEQLSDQKAIHELKTTFKRKQHKVALVLKKTLGELKIAHEKCETLSAEIEQLRATNNAIAHDQHRLAEGLTKAIQALRAGRKATDFDPLVEKKRIEETVSSHYKALLEEAEKKQKALEERIKKDEEVHSRLKKGFEDVLTSVKKEYEQQLLAKDLAHKQELSNRDAGEAEAGEYKKQVALLKAHLEGILIDKKKLEQTLRSLRQNETTPLENKLKELEILLQTKEDELGHIQKHLGRKIQEIAGLQDMLQEQEDKTRDAEQRVDLGLQQQEEIKAQNLRDVGYLNEEIASLKDIITQKAFEISDLQQEIMRLKDVEDDFEQMKESLALLQQNLSRAK